MGSCIDHTTSYDGDIGCLKFVGHSPRNGSRNIGRECSPHDRDDFGGKYTYIRWTVHNRFVTPHAKAHGGGSMRVAPIIRRGCAACNRLSLYLVEFFSKTTSKVRKIMLQGLLTPNSHLLGRWVCTQDGLRCWWALLFSSTKRALLHSC